MTHGLFRRARALLGDRAGSVFMILGFALVPLTFAVGMGVDYARAARMQTRLNALADAAALSTVTNPMMQQGTQTAATQAYWMWTQQAAGTPGMVTAYSTGCCWINNSSSGSTSATDGGDGTLHITVTDTTTTGHSRTATVIWHAASKNSFAALLGFSQIELAGTSTTAAKQAPNIDFYVLVDTSGSMAFPSTSAGIAQLQTATGGCAFACHNTNDTKAKDKNGNLTDYYGVATSYGIPLRVDEARKAVQSMMTNATSTASNNNAAYRAALYSFASKDSIAYNGYRQLQSLTSNLALVSTQAANIKTSFYYANNYNYNNSSPAGNYFNNDTDTATSDAFTRINSAMPTPGNGTNQSGDKPQQIMFIITDGMRDETRASGVPEFGIDTSLCNAIKARGIRIGIIYTEYLASALANDTWSQNNVAPYLYQVEPALQSCASSGLYYKVTTDDDISAALNKLFQAAVATARITQ